MNLNERIQHYRYRLGRALGWIPPEEQDPDIPRIEELKADPDNDPDYLQRFFLSPLEEPTQVLGREKDQEDLQRAYQNWKQAQRPLLLIGEPGCGMTSFIHAAHPILDKLQLLSDDYRIYTRKRLLADLGKVLGLEEVSSIEKLAEQLPADEERIIVFENVERIFLRKLGGFDLLDDLRTLINLTSDRIFWILTTNQYPLDYLDKIRGVRTLFNSSWELRPFSETYIEETIHHRNKGYQAIFLNPEAPTPLLELELRRAGPEEKQELLKKHFFKKLHDFAKGNISRALLFWVESIQGMRHKSIYLKPFSSKDPSKIDEQELFALEAIFQHNSLSVEDLETVLRQEGQPGRLTIAKLLQEKWIFPRQLRGHTQEYQINLLHQSELSQLLKDHFNRKMKTN